MGATSSEEQLLELLYACPVGLIECDAAGEIAMMNPHAMQHLMPLAGGRDVGNLFTALERHAPELRSIVAAHRLPTGQVCDGHRIAVDLGSGAQARAPMILSCTLVRLGPDRLVATLADISRQVAQEERLRQANTWFAALLDGVDEYAALAIDSGGRIVSADACFARQTGHDRAAVVGRSLAEILDADTAEGTLRLSEQLDVAGRDGWHLQEGWQQRADGGRYWCQRLVVARSEGDHPLPSGYSVILREVARRGAAPDDMRRLLLCDHLTGAANRHHFRELLKREQAQWQNAGQPLALIVLDLDHFKAVNDRFGHPTGDVLLCRVAGACAALLPARGLFARLGGEEFGVLLPRHDRDQAMALAERMRAAIAALEVDTPRGLLKATASLGCATLDEAKGSSDALIAMADERLYHAKHAGRNRVWHPLAHAA